MSSDADRELCLCFHVTRRKVENFIRVERPRVASQISECGGAGTGCGWCRPILERLLAEFRGERVKSDLPDEASYRAGRQSHLLEQKKEG
ncbi:(2Fe-2S)-binding protein [Planctomycetaceae bacterium SH139]